MRRSYDNIDYSWSLKRVTNEINDHKTQIKESLCKEHLKIEEHDFIINGKFVIKF